MKNLKVDYKSIKSVSFTSKNGIDVKASLNGDNTVSVIHRCSSTSGIQADFNREDLKEYIEYLQAFYDVERIN